jgi:chromosomal replication initiation ATPase DnaA
MLNEDRRYLAQQQQQQHDADQAALDEARARAHVSKASMALLAPEFSAIATRHGVSLCALFGRSRAPYIVRARWECYTLLRNEPYHWSLVRIGQLFDRDHTTIMYGLGIRGRKLRPCHTTETSAQSEEAAPRERDGL